MIKRKNMRTLLFVVMLSSSAQSETILEMNNYEPIPKKADVAAGCEVIVNGIKNNPDIAGAIVGGVIGGGFNARTIVGAAVGAYMSRPSGGGRNGSNP
jgi:hypothetical protein